MRKGFIGLLLAAGLSLPAFAQEDYRPTPENLQTRQAFQDNKFGIFLHYGIYSMMADGEWVMNNRNLNHEEYAKLAGGFYPSRFNAAEWVAAFKAAGAKYICFTTRHHDGFSMFNSRYSDFNVVEATPFKRDIVKELADECHKQGLSTSTTRCSTGPATIITRWAAPATARGASRRATSRATASS